MYYNGKRTISIYSLFLPEWNFRAYLSGFLDRTVQKARHVDTHTYTFRT